MAWVPARYDMVVETRLDRTGVDATANNIIRTARATARFFPQTAPGDLILFSQISSIRNEGRHEIWNSTLRPELLTKLSQLSSYSRFSCGRFWTMKKNLTP